MHIKPVWREIGKRWHPHLNIRSPNLYVLMLSLICIGISEETGAQVRQEEHETEFLGRFFLKNHPKSIVAEALGLEEEDEDEEETSGGGVGYASMEDLQKILQAQAVAAGDRSTKQKKKKKKKSKNGV